MRRRRTSSFPIVSASITVALAVSLLIGWTLVIVQNISLTQKVAENVTVLVLGLLSFVTIIVFVILFSVFLVRRNREINRQYTFIDSVTHELKTPLASLKLAVETLSRGDVPSKNQEELRKMMLGDISRLDLFIDDILAASQLTQKRAKKQRAEVNLGELLGSLSAVCRERHELAAEALSLEVPQNLTALSDRVGLSTVITNLLENAVKYSRQGDGSVPAIRIVVTKNERSIDIAVIDQGIGIESKFQKSVFERFFRVPSDAVRRRHGSGLGLFVAAEICRSVGARIRVDASVSGQGTTFTVSLPA